MTEPTSAQDLFKGRHFDQEIIVLCIRWYLTFKLELPRSLSHTTILRWVQQYVPEFEKRWNHYARSVGDSWRVDETYIKVKGMPVRHLLEEILTEYIVAAGLQSGQPPCSRPLISWNGRERLHEDFFTHRIATYKPSGVKINLGLDISLGESKETV